MPYKLKPLHHVMLLTLILSPSKSYVLRTKNSSWIGSACNCHVFLVVFHLFVLESLLLSLPFFQDINTDNSSRVNAQFHSKEKKNSFLVVSIIIAHTRGVCHTWVIGCWSSFLSVVVI